MFNAQRSRFLRGSESLPQRPPGALREDEFVERCTRCGNCLERCPQGILVEGRGGFPEVDFSRGACTFCAACVTPCAPAALVPWENPAEAWPSRAHIGPACVAGRGVACYACQDACGIDAIRCFPAARRQPAVDPDRCTGCGACVPICPVAAVEVRPFRKPAP